MSAVPFLFDKDIPCIYHTPTSRSLLAPPVNKLRSFPLAGQRSLRLFGPCQRMFWRSWCSLSEKEKAASVSNQDGGDGKQDVPEGINLYRMPSISSAGVAVELIFSR
jgi:hypothetical protein